MNPKIKSKKITSYIKPHITLLAMQLLAHGSAMAYQNKYSCNCRNISGSQCVGAGLMHHTTAHAATFQVGNITLGTNLQLTPPRPPRTIYVTQNIICNLINNPKPAGFHEQTCYIKCANVGLRKTNSRENARYPRQQLSTLYNQVIKNSHDIKPNSSILSSITINLINSELKKFGEIPIDETTNKLNPDFLTQEQIEVLEKYRALMKQVLKLNRDL